MRIPVSLVKVFQRIALPLEDHDDDGMSVS